MVGRGEPSRRMVWVFLGGLAGLAGPGCGRTTSTTSGADTQRTGETAMKLTITSTAFQANGAIPKKHTGEGEDPSPALAWSGVPAGAAELALIVDDPDAPTAEPWVHWVIYKIPPATAGLKEGVAKMQTLSDPAGALQGKNSWNTVGYRGPLPPPGHGTHHYHFKLYALDKAVTLPAGAAKKQLLDAMKGHIVAEGKLVGTYAR